MSDRTYAVQYWSASKKAFLAINDMPTPHLKNAEKKLQGVIGYYAGEKMPAEVSQPNGDDAVLLAIQEELAARAIERPIDEDPS